MVYCSVYHEIALAAVITASVLDFDFPLEYVV